LAPDGIGGVFGSIYCELFFRHARVIALCGVGAPVSGARAGSRKRLRGLR
jgi:hypothetical protein